MELLNSYSEFITRVIELGFMPLSDIIPGLPSVSHETRENQWHTGDPDTDPWQWKDRAATEKQLAFGCLLGGNKGFIAPRMYPYFRQAFQLKTDLEEVWMSGMLRPAVWEVWKYFEPDGMQSTSEIHRAWKASGKRGTAAADGALRELQMLFLVTVAGNRQRQDRFGQPFGWPSLLYGKTEEWVPESWMAGMESISPMEAREAILSAGIAMAPMAGREAIAKLFRIWMHAS